MHFITANPWKQSAADEGVRIMFKNRHSPEFLPGMIRHIAGTADEYVIDSDVKVQGIAPGQFAAIYDPTARICYGSGIISGRNSSTL